MGGVSSAQRQQIEAEYKDEILAELQAEYNTQKLAMEADKAAVEADLVRCETNRTADQEQCAADKTAMQNQCNDEKTRMQNEFNDEKTRMQNEFNAEKEQMRQQAAECAKQLQKSFAARMHLGSDPSVFVKQLWNKGTWSIYIAKDFNKLKNHEWYKYLWSVALLFKNTNNFIVIYCSEKGTISPTSQPETYFWINEKLFQAQAEDANLTAYNLKEVVANPLLAQDYSISFWGAYKQKSGDSGYEIPALLNHETTGERHGNRNQTGWMWRWMHDTVEPGRAPADELNAFKRSGRVVGEANFSGLTPGQTLQSVDASKFYVKRPALPT